MVEDRDTVMRDLHRLNIGTGVHYRPVHLHDYYRRRYGYEPGMFPNAEWIGEHTLSLPLSPGMSGHDVQDVIDAVRKVLA
jgi:dTDP-4-amino-4,6-dideoxygalactose transaminase